MPFDNEIEIEVIERKGHCSVDHKVGDTFKIKGYKTPGGVCLSAFHAIWPVARTLLLDGVHPWEKDKNVSTVACPDPDNPIVFRIKRVKK